MDGIAGRQKPGSAPLRWTVMPTYLADILIAHRARAAADQRDPEHLAQQAAQIAPPRDFRAALQVEGLSCIAEVKRRSPSKGDLAPDLQPDVVAKEYLAGGAACLSVLTDVDHFGGSVADLQQARQAATGLPVLRKDFTVQEADVLDARLMEADAVLLIAAALDDDELAHLAARAASLGLAALVEVHDEEELARALHAGATLIGVNQRDLRTFEVDHDRACALASRIPAGVVAVAESGIRHADDARRLADAGYYAILVGETLLRAADRSAAVQSLIGYPVAPR
jgi:indole-3-glycerol phosphate synthase